ncbi:MAG: VOC family protein [Thermoleophilia bacterium]|nr:VOC family protein [Thermoleophilia bacterium]
MSERARLVGINHVAIEVGDLDEALDFYGKAFDVTLRGRAGAMAFLDMGDQFLALEAAPTQAPDRGRHIGIVVDDRERALRLLEEAGGGRAGRNDVLDPWGNRLQIVDYREVQFTKAPSVLAAMGLEGLEKTEQALAELREKGIEPAG